MDREEIENQLERLQRLFECYLKMGEQIANHPDWRMNIEFVEDLEQTLERRRSELLKKEDELKDKLKKEG